MPLKHGRSRDVIGDNIGEMVRSFTRTGKIGNTTPRSASHAQLIATAAAHQSARDSKPRK